MDYLNSQTDAINRHLEDTADLEKQKQINQQQFCLRWHNHKTSLLSTLPILLDQSHLTDVTITAEGHSVRAHRVVLSACSTFFLELFRSLDGTTHPVIIVPGASFEAIISLLTFMYSGEVNVYEEQIPMLLNLAETLGIKGLADVQNNLQTSSTASSMKKHQLTCNDLSSLLRKEDTDTLSLPPSTSSSSPVPPATLPNSPQTQFPTSTPLLTTASSGNSALLAASALPPNKLTNPLESLFLKSLQFYPSLLPQPLNFSNSALNKTSELLAKYQQQCNLYEDALAGLAAKEMLNYMTNNKEEHATAISNDAPKRFRNNEKTRPTMCNSQMQQKSIKCIDKIVENLRSGGSNKSPSPVTSAKDTADANAAQLPYMPHHQQQTQMQLQQLHAQLSMKSQSNCFAAALPQLLSTKPTLQSAMSNLAKSASPILQPTHSVHQQQLQKSRQLENDNQLTVITKGKQNIDDFSNMNAESIARTYNYGHTDNACLTVKSEANLTYLQEKLSVNPQLKSPSNSKLYATCYVCHKQLSNQYNLRVHLETHQNMRYACNVCSHVSRSKDALRKHVSYRHPGVPSPSETEARRKRRSGNSKLLTSLRLPTTALAKTEANATSPSDATSFNEGNNGIAKSIVSAVTINSATPIRYESLATSATSLSAKNDCANTDEASGENNAQIVAAAAAAAAAAVTTQLNTPYMFLPGQYNLVAAASAQQQQQQQEQQQQEQQTAYRDNVPATSSSNAVATTDIENCSSLILPTSMDATSTTAHTEFKVSQSSIASAMRH